MCVRACVRARARACVLDILVFLRNHMFHGGAGGPRPILDYTFNTKSSQTYSNVCAAERKRGRESSSLSSLLWCPRGFAA